MYVNVVIISSGSAAETVESWESGWNINKREKIKLLLGSLILFLLMFLPGEYNSIGHNAVVVVEERNPAKSIFVSNKKQRVVCVDTWIY